MNKAQIFKERIISSWDRQYQIKAKVIYPKSIKNLKNIINNLKKKNKTYIIRTGECSYNSKSIPANSNTFVISLINLNRIISVSQKAIEVEAGALIRDIINKIKFRKLSLYSVPGGSEISLGGAISANVIGKDSNPTFACFGDTIERLDVLKDDGSIISLKKNKKSFYKYIGGFGVNGIIIAAKLKVKRIKSQNIELKTNLINNIDDLIKELKQKSDYKYIHLNPFFWINNFGLVIKGTQVNKNKNYYNYKKLSSNTFEKFFFDFFSYFPKSFILALLYKIFFYKKKSINKIVDIHNFHYPDKYTHLVPRLSTKYLCDFEILIKKNYKSKISEIIFFLKKEKLYPIYIVVKKVYKSKKKYFYNFCDNGYSMSIAFDKNALTYRKELFFKKLLNKQNSPLNMTKIDEPFFKIKKNENSFMSLFKKKLLIS